MTLRPLNVLISHECSGVSRRAWRALGHSAWSCDLLPATDGERKFHIQGDGIEAMRRGRPTDGAPWDFVLTHHVCRYLANSGALRLYKGGKKENGIDPVRWNACMAGAQDFRSQFFVPEYKGPICAENPVMHKWAREAVGLPEMPRQMIQPYMFGDDASKGTQLWLRDLPPLVVPDKKSWFPPRAVCPKCHTVEQGAPDLVERALSNGCIECGAKCLPRWSNQTDSGQNKLAPSADRAHKRAITYIGIARAMAEQWSAYLLNKTNPCTPSPSS